MIGKVLQDNFPEVKKVYLIDDNIRMQPYLQRKYQKNYLLENIWEKQLNL